MEYALGLALLLQLICGQAHANLLVTPDNSPAAIAVGKNVTLSANINMTINAGFWNYETENIVFWYPSGMHVQTVYRSRVSFNRNDYSLMLTSVQVSDSGMYVMVGADPQYRQELDLSVQVAVSNVNVTVSSTNLVEFNDSVTFMCAASGTPLRFHWVNKTSVLAPGSRVLLSSDSRTVTIKEISRFDTGPFICNVSNNISHLESSAILLNISYGPSNPMMSVTPDKMAYISGSHVNLSCSAESKPASSYMWSFNGSNMNQYGQHLHLSNLMMSQTGEYTCLIHNSVTSRYAQISRSLQIIDPVSAVMVTQAGGPPILNMTFALNCYATGPVDWRYWMKNGTVLHSDDDISFSHDNMTLTIRQVDMMDNGDYQCMASNPVSSRTSQVYTLKVNYGPKMVNIKGPSIIAAGTKLMLYCTAESWPPSNLTWYFNGSVVGDGPHYHLNNASLSNSGNYMCSARNSITNITEMATMEVKVIELINSVVVMATGQPPINHKRFTLACHVDGTVYDRIWWMNGKSLNPDNRTTISSDGSMLTFDPVMMSDDGHYQCMASNPLSNRTSVMFQLKVNYGPINVSASGPSIIATATNVTLTCAAHSRPPSNFTWSFNGTEVAMGPLFHSNTLTPAHSGEYTCTAHNSITGLYESASTMLTIIDPISHVRVNPLDGPPILNMTFKLSCDITEVVDNIHWMRNGTYLHSHHRLSLMDGNRTLSFNPVELTDNGDYQCMAMNAVSSQSSSPYTLMVNYGPWDVMITGKKVAATGSNITFMCSASSWPSSGYNWYFNGSIIGQGHWLQLIGLTMMSEGEYTCMASNSVTGMNASAVTHLRVVAPITEVMVDPNGQVPVLGRSFWMMCQANSEMTSIAWVKDNATDGWNSTMTFSQNNANMTMDAVSLDYEGDYQCIARNDVSQMKSPVFTLRVNFGPDDVRVSGPMLVETGYPATFNCSAQSWPPSNFTWYQSNTMVASGPQYTIKTLTLAANGNYTCKAHNNITGLTRSTSTTLRVIEGITSVVLQTNPEIPRDSEDFSLTCEVSGPYDELQWLRNGQPLDLNNTLTLSNNSTMLHFKPLRRENDGIYQCSAENELKVHLSGAYDLRASYGPNHVVISLTTGKPVTLVCMAESQPPSMYEWSIDGNIVSTNSEITVSVIQALSDTITCRAKNPLTNVSVAVSFDIPDDAAPPLQSRMGMTFTLLVALFLSLFGSWLY